MELLRFEKDLYDKGLKLIAGVDEVGRGPLAGPMVVAAVILDLDKIFQLRDEFVNFGAEKKRLNRYRNNDVLLGNLDLKDTWEIYSRINDSKRVSKTNREIINTFIRTSALSFSIVEISNREIDKVGISKATQITFSGAVRSLKIIPEHILTDSFEIKNLTKSCQTNIKRGDSSSISIAAASIIAKVYRDSIMESHHEKYPEYGFDKHKGYGTKHHLEMLGKHGPCEIHRRSFAPVKVMA